MKSVVGERGQIVIPKKIREKLRLEKGTLLDVDTTDDNTTILIKPPPQSAVRYLKFGYLQRPSVGVALRLSLGDGGLIRDVRVAVGCAGPKPCRVEEAEELLKGKGLQEASELIGEAGQIAGRAAEAIGDLHGSAEYKEHIIQVLLKRAFHQMVKEEFSSKGDGGPHA